MTGPAIASFLGSLDRFDCLGSLPHRLRVRMLLHRRVSVVLLSLASFVATAGLVLAQEAVETSSSTAPETQSQTSAVSSSKAKKLAGRSIQEAMTPDEFKAAGLDKLSEDELQHLDAWLQGYRQTTEKHATEEAQKKADVEIKKVTAQTKGPEKKLLVNRVTSRVDGAFTGLTGHTVITLEDGTVWKQANKEDRYRSPVTDHPMASVAHGAFGYKMRMEGTPEFYVNPVRTNE